MTISFYEFINQIFQSPMLFITSILILCIIFVNGFTDAPNSIATCICTRSLSPKKAIIMAAVFDFLGALIMTIFNANVAYTIFNMVDFGENARKCSNCIISCNDFNSHLGNSCMAFWDSNK